MIADTQLPSADQIDDIVEQVVSTHGLSAVPCAAFEPDSDEPSWTGWVTMRGGFRGVVTLHCSVTLAERIAATMLGLSPSEVPDDAARDAFAELAHVIAGNIKPLICREGEPMCVLGEPEVLSGVAMPGGTSLRVSCFTCGAHRFSVRLWELPEPAETRPPRRQS